MYQWSEDDCTLPAEFFQGFSAPVDGKTRVMYHGTSREKAADILVSGFRQSKNGLLGRGIYLSCDLRKASYYPIDHPEHDKVIIEVLVNVGKMIVINRKGHPRQKNWHNPRYGPVYDTAWIPRGCGLAREMDCVWDPNRIKILSIKPHPDGPYGYAAWGNIDTETNMYQWAEDDSPVMYHGTSREEAADILVSGFCWSKNGLLGRGIYLSRDPKKASYYPVDHPEHDKVIIKVLVDVGKVIVINRKGHPRQKNWHNPRYGPVYDTAWLPRWCGLVREMACVWNPDRITILSIKPHPDAPYGYAAWGNM